MTVASLSLSGLIIILALVFIVAFYVRRLGRAESNLSNETERVNAFKRFNRALSKPVLRGRDLVAGLRSWSRR